MKKVNFDEKLILPPALRELCGVEISDKSFSIELCKMCTQICIIYKPTHRANR